MNKWNDWIFWALILSLIWVGCRKPIYKDTVANPGPVPAIASVSEKLNKRGKMVSVPKFSGLYTEVPLDSLAWPAITHNMAVALEDQLRLLELRRRSKLYKLGHLQVSIDDLKEVAKILLTGQFGPPYEATSLLEAHQIWGNDQRGNVYFTGYFTPILQVRKTPNSYYRYPIYARPKDWEGDLPSRHEIDSLGVLKGKGLELAYAGNLIDIYFMQVQGSGIVEYPNGQRELFAHSGSNGHPYRSIGKHMINKGYTTPDKVSIPSLKQYFKRHPEHLYTILSVNPSYIFFQPIKSMPTGAGHVPLTAHHAVAVDPRYIPLGSCLLASVPVSNRQKRFSHHENRLLVAQDIGGAIKGAGHVDVYCGLGERGKYLAGALHYYGQMWLLLPRQAKPLTNK